MSKRTCGGCDLCCSLVPVRGIDKRGFTCCPHQRVALDARGPGCGVYLQRPGGCRTWSCLWLGAEAEGWPEALRPDRCGVVFDENPDVVTDIETGKDIPALVAWVRPGKTRGQIMADASVRAIARAYIEKQGMAVVFRLGPERAFTMRLVAGEIMVSPERALAPHTSDEEVHARLTRAGALYEARHRG